MTNLSDISVVAPCGPNRESRNVLPYVCAGYSNKEIARFLGKAEPTVKHQVSACLRKFGLSSRMRLMVALR
ncbi:MAG TPA: LuxR C-terminal-related transcriptional regulator [Lacunisphaera sp.]|jgi:DNA-binding NarL/FixJ family response regulator|nr:response regulator transcription factor [Lacunisphaera sp.]HQY04983.1 LuxR C-terminal-related transcriptional regulator [Lacunisphaera sp.]